jgi:hypothetical protein
VVVTVEQQGLLAFSQLFMGGQAHRYTGSYLTTDGIAMTESCTVIRAYTEEVEQHLPHLLTLASEIARALKQ